MLCPQPGRRDLLCLGLSVAPLVSDVNLWATVTRTPVTHQLWLWLSLHHQLLTLQVHENVVRTLPAPCSSSELQDGAQGRETAS